MKTKIWKIISVLLVLILCSGCGNDDIENTQAPQILKADISYEAEGGSGSIELSVNPVSAKVITGSEWCSVSLSNVIVNVTVQENAYMMGRSAMVAVSYSGIEDILIPITQTGGSVVPLYNDTWLWDFNYTADFFNMSNKVKEWLQASQEYNNYYYGEQLTVIAFLMYNGKPSIRFSSYDGSTPTTWQVVYNYTAKLIYGTNDKFVFDSNYVEDLNAEYYPWFTSEVVTKFLAEGTYVLTPDNIKNPTQIKFTSEREPDIWFYVHK
jgi:hypothetical protein